MAMKNKIITVIDMKKFFCLIIAVIFCFSLCSCSSLMKRREQNISELRDELMVSEFGNDKVTLISGRRENPFVVDGKSGEKIDFTVVTFYPEKAMESARFTYRFDDGTAEIEGEFCKHPFKNTYSFEIAKRITGNAMIVIEGDNYEHQFDLASVKTANTIMPDQALEKAELRLGEHIKKLTSGNKLNAEIFIRFLENPISSQGGYYWYVAFVPDKYAVYATLIHPETGEIIATREG